MSLHNQNNNIRHALYLKLQLSVIRKSIFLVAFATGRGVETSLTTKPRKPLISSYLHFLNINC